MSIDLGQIDQIDYRESIRRKLSTKRQNSNRQDVAWGGSLRNLVVQQSFIRVRSFLSLFTLKLHEAQAEKFLFPEIQL